MRTKNLFMMAHLRTSQHTCSITKILTERETEEEPEADKQDC